MTDLRGRDLNVELGGATVLAGVSVDVPAGSWVSVVGPNGAGKSTLLRALAGLVAARGTVELGGEPAAVLRRPWGGGPLVGVARRLRSVRRRHGRDHSGGQECQHQPHRFRPPAPLHHGKLPGAGRARYTRAVGG